MMWRKVATVVLKNHSVQEVERTSRPEGGWEGREQYYFIDEK